MNSLPPYKPLLIALLLAAVAIAPARGEDDLRSRLKKAVRSHVQEGLAKAGLVGEVTQIQLPARSADMQPGSTLKPLRAFIPARAAGRYIIPMEIIPPEGRPFKLYVAVTTVAVVEGWTTRFALKRGAALESGQFYRKTVRVATREADYVQEDLLPEQYQLTTSLKPGQLLRHHYIEPVPAVNIGDQVTIYFKSDTITLVSPGKARRKGRIGEIIPVVATATGKRFFGRLTSPGVVVVE